MSQPNPKYWKVWSGPDTLPWFSPVSLFDSTNPWHWTVGVQLAPSTDGKYYLVVLTNDNDQYLGNISDIPFPTETWVRIRLEVDNDRIARLYQDGQLISTHPLGSDSKLGTTGGHWGLYAGRDLKNLTVLNDNITLVVYPAKSD